MDNNYLSQTGANALFDAFSELYANRKDGELDTTDMIRTDRYEDTIERIYTYSTSFTNKRNISDLRIVEKRVGSTEEVVSLHDVSEMKFVAENGRRYLYIRATLYNLYLEIEPETE